MQIDLQKNKITLEDGKEIVLYSPEGFKILSDLWLKVGWDQKHMYSLTWLGRPIIQIPDDMVRMQEVIYAVKPDVIVETGIAHGGSLIFYASLLKAMGKGKVVGVDVEIRPHNRTAIEAHELFPLITMIEGSSVEPEVVEQVKTLIPQKATTLFILDSNHDYDHVLKELQLYSPLVSVGSYIVATDGSRESFGDTPRARQQYPLAYTWGKDNPKRAALDFVKEHKDFGIEEPKFLFNEGSIDFRVTHYPCAFVKRIR